MSKLKSCFYAFMGRSNPAAAQYHQADLREYRAVFVAWSYKTAIFYLLPVIVYLCIYIILDIHVSKILSQPELLIIAILLVAQSGQKTLERDQKFSGSESRIARTISYTLIPVVIFSVLLSAKIMSTELSIPLIDWFDEIQFAAVILALLHNCYTNVRIDAHSGIGAKLIGRKIND